jgi:hypothetical protein
MTAASASRSKRHADARLPSKRLGLGVLGRDLDDFIEAFFDGRRLQTLVDMPNRLLSNARQPRALRVARNGDLEGYFDPNGDRAATALPGQRQRARSMLARREGA